MSWRQASIEALRRSGPMTASDILGKIETLELREITGLTPEATIGSILYTAIKNGDVRIRLISRGIFELIEQS